MSIEILFATILLPALFGTLTAVYLRRPLARLLVGECGTEQRADFWTRLAVTGLVLGPTALALMRADHWSGVADPVDVFRVLLSTSLNGVLVVLALLALAIWRQIPRRAATVAPAGENAS